MGLNSEINKWFFNKFEKQIININLGNLLEKILNMTRRQKGGIRTWISKAQNFRKKLVYLESESRKPVF